MCLTFINNQVLLLLRMGGRKVYHLGLSKDEVKGAKYVFLPGDPARVPLIAKAFDPNSKEIAFKREYRSWLGQILNTPVLVTSTGIGGSSTSIAVEELAMIGGRVFLRVGTTGAIQDAIKIGDIVISTGAVRLDGASTHYAPIEYPAVGDHRIVGTLIKAAKEEGVRYWAGITASSATFYPGQERYDSYSGYVINRFIGSMEEWKRLGVLNYEMESSTLFVTCSVFGLRAGCVSGVIGDRTQSEGIEPTKVQSIVESTIRVAVRAMKLLISEDRQAANT